MTGRDLGVGVLAHLAGFVVAMAIMRAADVGDTSFALIAAAIIGVQAAAVSFARREPADVTASFGGKLILGTALAGAAALAGLGAHWFAGPLEYPEVTVPIGAIGTAVFPFVVFETFRSALRPRG